MNDDAQLIDEALAGDSAAFGRLVTRYQDRLYNTLVHVVGSADEAHDMAQDAFVQAFLKLNTFHRTSAFYTWLYRIAFNLAVSRRRRQRPTSSIEHAAKSPAASQFRRRRTRRSPGPRRACESSSGGAGCLCEEFRSVLVLREIDGFCYESIAEVLDLPVGTVRSRLHRARIELREQLREALQEDLK